MLQRAFGSQIDLTGKSIHQWLFRKFIDNHLHSLGVGPPEVTTTKRSVECQTEDQSHLIFDPSLLSHRFRAPLALSNSNESNQLEYVILPFSLIFHLL